MNPVSNILSKSITAPYYRQNAGLFLFLFFLLFGTQPSVHHVMELHYSIIKSILTSDSFFMITLGIWILYSTKIISFVYGCFKKNAYDFLFLLNGVNKSRRFIYLLQMTIVLLAPALVYGLFITGVGINEKLWPDTIKILVAIIILLISTVFMIYFLLKKAKGLQQVKSHKSTLSSSLPVTLFRFLITFIFQRQFLSLLITKVLSFFSLYFFSRTESSLFEDRMLWMIFITALIGHSFIIFRLFNFIEQDLSFYRNMPVKKLVTLLSLFIIYIILLLPEAWALFGMAINQHNWNDYWWMLATGPSFLLLLHCLLYTEDMKIEEFLKLLFGVWIVFILFSLSKNHWSIPLVCLLIAAIIFFILYSRYEKNMEVEDI